MSLKKISLIIMLIYISICLHGQAFVLNSNSQTLSRIDLETGYTDNTFAVVGEWSNRVYLYQGTLYVVNSGDNSIQTIDPETGITLSNIMVENFSNPFAMAFYENYGYVTGLITNKVYKIDLEQEVVVDEINVGLSPAEILVLEDYLYVLCTGYQYPSYNNGELYKIDLETFEVFQTLTLAINTQDLTVSPDGFLHIIATGNYSTITGIAHVVNSDSMEIINNIELGGQPGTIYYAQNGLVFCGDGFGLGVYIYDANTLEVLYDASDLFFSGATKIYSNSEHIGILDAGNWMNSSTLSIFDYELNYITQYHTGIGSIDFFFVPEDEEEEEDKFPVEIKISGKGSTDLLPGIHYFEKGHELLLYPYPDPGFSFKKWQVNEEEFLGETLNLIVKDKYTIILHFEDTSSTENMIKDFYTHIYPNPYSRANNDFINIAVNGHGGIIESIEVFNIKGQKITTITNYSRQENLVWDAMSNKGKLVKPGIYLIKVNIPESTDNLIRKVIVK